MKMRKTFYDLSKQIVERKKLMMPRKRRYPTRAILFSTGMLVIIVISAVYSSSRGKDPITVAGKGYSFVSLESQSPEYRNAASFTMEVMDGYSRGGIRSIEKFCLVNDDCCREDLPCMLSKMDVLRGGQPEIGRIYRYSGWDDTYKVEIRSLQEKIVLNIRKTRNMGMGITSIE
ncbi:MAG: hypothetical protein A2X48_09275 [Lentisphaerae bacterium GWF2_49_21]|nr:MAG: hypothetical protein A2X48_09275 [Lentisphaerae bacterium GWF2_49_21]